MRTINAPTRCCRCERGTDRMRLVCLAAGWLSLLTMGHPATSGELLPPAHSPAEPPAVTSLGLNELTRRAILLFDASAVSERHYDLVACLDGLTFGFANMPQSNLHGFMTRMAADREGATVRTFVSRMTEHFRTDRAA